MALARPSYQAITIDLVGREDLANAVALNSSQFQLSRLVGPLLAGLGFSFFGLAGCFYANSISFLAVIIGFSKLQIVEKAYIHSVKDRKAFWQDLLAGVSYVRRRPRVFSLLLLSAVTSLFGTPYLTFIPVFARDIFHLGETGLALMMGAAGAGAFFGALTLAYLGDFKHKGWSVLGGAIAFGLWLIAFAQATSVRFSLISLFGVGFAVVTSVAVTNTLLQKLVTDEMRGRVMSMFIVSFIGTMPIGNLIGGALSQRYGAPATLTGAGIVIILFVTGMAIGNKRLRNLH